MSNGEVKRWILENHGGELFYSPIIDTYEEVVSSTDHERVVAEYRVGPNTLSRHYPPREEAPKDE